MIDYQAAREAMVDCQVRPSDVTSFSIIEAMLWAPRERFVPKARRDVAYAGEHVRVGDDRWALDPRVFAKMLDAAQISDGDVVLDLACGLGYSTAVIARLAAAVVAVEDDAARVSHAAAVLAELGVDNAVAQEGALIEGAATEGPYDVIFINGGVEQAPKALLEQLRDGGRLVAIWQDGALGQCRVVLRSGDVFSTRRVFDATAPLLPGFDAPRGFSF